MKKFTSMFMLLLFFFCANIHLGYPQTKNLPVYVTIPAVGQSKSADVNKDGKPDVNYYSADGKYVSKIEADTNYDGKPDVTVYLKDGKFESAEADTNYDGKVDKKFTDAGEFNKWVNETHPDFQDELNQPDWQFDLLKF